MADQDGVRPAVEAVTATAISGLAMIDVNPITALLLLRVFGPLAEGDDRGRSEPALGQYLIRLASRRAYTLRVRSHEAARQVSVAGGDRVVIDGDDLPAQLQRALGGKELALVLDSVGGPIVTDLAAGFASEARSSASARSAAGQPSWTSART